MYLSVSYHIMEAGACSSSTGHHIEISINVAREQNVARI